MSEPSLEFAHTDVELKSAPIRREWIIEGDPIARNKVLALSEDRMATTLVWDCTAGRFKWIYDVDETIHVLEGNVHLTDVDGSTRHLKAGDVVFFPAGSSATWQVDRYVRKLAFFRQPVPRPVSIFLRAFRKAAGLAEGVAGRGMATTGVEKALTAYGVEARPAERADAYILPLKGNRAA
jgi:uncharacterized cupin superfamily protein